jgi:hypothetical protein
VARAKRTDRAEARRRYRAQLAEQSDLETAEDTETGSPSASRKAGTPASARSGAAAPARVGMGEAFRTAFRPANYREDLAFLPSLLLHPSVWGPVLVTIASAGFVVATHGTDPISVLLAQYFVVPPPIAAIFIAGFFAPRASYLAGGIVGLVAALAFAVIAATTPTASATGGPGASPSPSAAVSAAPSGSAQASAGASIATSPSAEASPPASAGSPSASGASAAPGSPAASGSAAPTPQPSGATGATPTPARIDPATALTEALVVSPLSGVFFGAATAWYRRWLRAMNPNAGRRPAQRRGQTRRR